MNSILMKAVLSSAPDYECLFESLAWSGDSWPGTERVDALTAVIDALGCSMADVDTSRFTDTNRNLIKEKIHFVIWQQCLPMFSTLSANMSDGMRERENITSVCRLLNACVPLCEESVSESLALSVLASLAPSEAEVPGPGRLRVEVACEVMAALIPSVWKSERLTLSLLSSALLCIRTLPDALVSKVTARLLLPLLGCSSDETLGGILKSILDDLCSWYSAGRSPVVTERTLLCLTVLSDHIMKPQSFASCSDPRLSPQFWMIVQDGLTHRDSVSRKRALYLLKKCLALSEDMGVECPLSTSGDEELLFRWTPHRRKLLREFWEDFVLLMETLEENQVHVVRPVLNRIDTLIQTTVSDSQDSIQGLFHPSWLLCVYQRMFHSENKSLMREGVCHLLQLQVLRQPGFALAFSQFIAGPLMDALSESSLFNRTVGQSVGDCPELGAKLQVFMVAFFSSLPSQHRGHILLKMVRELCLKHWCAVPLLFLSQALSKLPPSPLLGIGGLAALREVLRCTMITHQVLLRGAAQCFLLNSALQQTDVSSVTLDDVFKILMDFRADESLCRGTTMWKQVCVWISDNEGKFKAPTPNTGDGVKSETVRSYIQQELETYLRVPASNGQTESLPNTKEADKLSRAILLCVDMESTRAGTGISESLESLLSPLLETLSRVSTNIYLPVRKSDKSLQLVLRLFQHGKTPRRQHAGEEQADEAMAVMEQLIFRTVDQIQEFIMRRLLGELQELCDVERAELYLSVLQQLVVRYHSVPQYGSKIQQNYFCKIINHSLKVLQDTSEQVNSVANQVAKFVAMASLGMVCGLLEEDVFAIQSEIIAALKTLNGYFYSQMSSSSECLPCLGNFNQSLQRPETADTLRDAEMLHDWGRISATFLRHQWVCLSFLIEAVGIPDSVEVSRVPETRKAALSCSVEALALLPSGLVLPVLTFMKTVLPQLLFHDDVLCVEAVSLSWRLVQGLSTNAHDFWPALKGFISVTFHHQLLQLTDSQAPALVPTLRQITSELMELSQSKSGVFGVLLQHCCQLWLPADHVSNSAADTMFCSVFNHVNILTEACVYGPVFRRDQRLIQDVQTYVERLGDACAANVAVTSDNRDDHQPRTCVLAFLSHLDSSNELHQRLMEKLVSDLLEKENDISQSKVRYYSNSLQHRVKNRVWQTLLLLLPKLREEFIDSVADRVFEAGFCSNQASVKYLIEWMMILILVYYPHHMDNFWRCFSKDHEKTKTSSCTFLSVLVHFNVIIPKLQDQAAQLGKALDVILQWCFNHNFSVRLYALLALKRVWSLAEAKAAEGLDGFDGLSTVVKACLSQAEAMQSTGNANKNWVKIQEHFFFGCFHPLRDYSVETIFYTFPNLSDLADDEWIPPCKFENLTNFSESPSLPLRNPAPDLRDHQPGDWIQQDKGEQNKEDCWAEVQKKITPWKSGLQEQEAELQLVPQQRAVRLGKQHGALVVVASLIDKPTNLGGLCRTCEIFGASVLVLDSLHHVRDKHFQSLSVSSELWLPLMEVKPVQLTDFLQVKKNEGYCIVGVEQTANSRSLQDYQFPEKTLLILGNEREGIPANLLQMLDVCVEIPQQGIVRSLNVHIDLSPRLRFKEIRACLGNIMGGVKVRTQGEDGESSNLCTADPRPTSSSEGSAGDGCSSMESCGGLLWPLLLYKVPMTTVEEMNQNGSCTFTSRHRPVESPSKYRSPPGEQTLFHYGNITYDRRVIRGNVYAQNIISARRESEPAARQQPVRWTSFHKHPKEQFRIPAAEALSGRTHIDVQTDRYLEELSEEIQTVDNSCETGALLDQPATPLFIPAKTGKDVETQIEEGELFDFDREVEPILEVLVGKVMEQSLVEVMEEEELASLKAQQRAFEELRNYELAEVQRLQEQERRRKEEKERRLAQQREVLRKERETAQKIAARAYTQKYMSGLLTTVFSSLRTDGYFYDPIEREIECNFVPWLMSEVDKNMEKRSAARELLDNIIFDTAQERREGLRKQEEKKAKSD